VEFLQKKKMILFIEQRKDKAGQTSTKTELLKTQRNMANPCNLTRLRKHC